MNIGAPPAGITYTSIALTPEPDALARSIAHPVIWNADVTVELFDGTSSETIRSFVAVRSRVADVVNTPVDELCANATNRYSAGLSPATLAVNPELLNRDDPNAEPTSGRDVP